MNSNLPDHLRHLTRCYLCGRLVEAVEDCDCRERGLPSGAPDPEPTDAEIRRYYQAQPWRCEEEG